MWFESHIGGCIKSRKLSINFRPHFGSETYLASVLMIQTLQKGFVNEDID
jgi:hypothetical protein